MTSKRVLCPQMTAEREKLNTQNTLGAFWRVAGPEFHKVQVMTSGKVTRRIVEGDGSGDVVEVARHTRRFTLPGPVGSCSAEGLKFPDAEQDRARTLARVNARTGGMFGTGADLFILTRQQLRKGILRVWRSASPVRAVSSWQAQAFPLFNRLKRNPGAFSPVSSPELLKVGKSHADPGNSPAA